MYTSLNHSDCHILNQDVIVPGMHEEDMPDDILALDKNPRLVGTIHKWLFEYEDNVKEGDLLVSETIPCLHLTLFLTTLAT